MGPAAHLDSAGTQGAATLQQKAEKRNATQVPSRMPIQHTLTHVLGSGETANLVSYQYRSQKLTAQRNCSEISATGAARISMLSGVPSAPSL